MIGGKMAPKSVQTALKMPADDPRHATRATRTAGRQMRSRLLDGASRLFRERGLAGTSISDIAAAADAVGVMVGGHAMGRSAEEMCSEMLRVLGDQATAKTTDDNTRLRLVGERDASDSDSPDGERSS